MTEIIKTLKRQIERINSIVEGLEDKSKLSYPREYDLGESVLGKVISDLSKVKERLSNSQDQSWLLSLIRTLSSRG